MGTDSGFSFKTALNTSTLRPFDLDVKEQIEVCVRSGYQGIELWVRDLNEYLNNGGRLDELRRYIEDAGIEVINGVAFFKWTDADKDVRREGFEQAKKEMELLAAIGCRAVAAPPTGNVDGVSLDEMATNFERLVRIGREIGVEPYLEIWGHTRKLSKLSHAVYIMLESGVIDAKMLVDIYHLYKGGSSFDGIRFLNGNSIGLVHINDYPAYPPRDKIADKDRVFPGDGVAPIGEFLKYLIEIGYEGYLSLELFIQDYGDKDPYWVARYGREKIQSIQIPG